MAMWRSLIANHEAVPFLQAIAGLMPDARQLVSRAREEAAAHRRSYGEPILPQQLNDVRWWFRRVG